MAQPNPAQKYVFQSRLQPTSTRKRLPFPKCIYFLSSTSKKQHIDRTHIFTRKNHCKKTVYFPQHETKGFTLKIILFQPCYFLHGKVRTKQRFFFLYGSLRKFSHYGRVFACINTHIPFKLSSSIYLYRKVYYSLNPRYISKRSAKAVVDQN